MTTPDNNAEPLVVPSITEEEAEIAVANALQKYEVAQKELVAAEAAGRDSAELAEICEDAQVAYQTAATYSSFVHKCAKAESKLRSLLSSDAIKLLNRLRGVVCVHVDDGAGPLPDGSTVFTRYFETPDIQHEAATFIEYLIGLVAATDPATFIKQDDQQPTADGATGM